MTVESIKSQDDLREYLSGLEKSVQALGEKEWAGRLAAGAARQDRGDPKAAERFKSFITGVVRGNLGMVRDGGGQAIQGSVEKTSPTGTPLYSDTASGSYLVPVEFMREVQYQADQAAVISPLCRHVGMSARTMSVPKESTALSAYWVTSQSSGLTETNPTFTSETMTAYALAAYIPIHEDLLTDDAAGVYGFFAQRFGEKFASKLDAAILDGNADPHTGILHASGVHEQVMGAGNTTSADISYDDILDVIGHLTAAQRRGAQFFVSPGIQDRLRYLKDSNGRPLVVDPTAASPGTLAGYPLRVTDEMPASATASQSFLVFGNPASSILVGDRKLIDIRLYEGTFYNATAAESFIRAYARYGVLVVQPTAWVKLTTAAA